MSVWAMTVLTAGIDNEANTRLFCVRADDREPVLGIAEHSGGQIDPERGARQAPDQGGPVTCAAPNFERHAPLLRSSSARSARSMPSGCSGKLRVRAMNSRSYQSAMAS